MGRPEESSCRSGQLEGVFSGGPPVTTEESSGVRVEWGGGVSEVRRTKDSEVSSVLCGPTDFRTG